MLSVNTQDQSSGFIVFETSSPVLFSLLATEHLGLGMKWQKWKARRLLVTQNAEIICTSIAFSSYWSAQTSKVGAADTVIFDIKTIKISKISLEAKANDVKREIGLHVKCKLINNSETYFRCIIPENEISDFYNAIKKVSKVHNIDDIADLHSNFEDGEYILSAKPILASTQSVMRRAVATAMDQLEERQRKLQIIHRRGVMKWLPVYFKNDLIHGSWWFVLGSALMLATSTVVLYNSYESFAIFRNDEDSPELPLELYRSTWALMVVSSTFFTLGSLAFVRALHDDPPIKPLFGCYHLESDELLASWLFLFATVPFIPYCLIYMGQAEDKALYLISVIISVLMTIGTYLFVLASYPANSEKNHQIILRALSCCYPSLKKTDGSLTHFCCCIEDLRVHVENDWLAGTWLVFFGTFISFIGSVGLMFLYIDRRNYLNMFIYASAFCQNLFFFLGSAYFVAGSYGSSSTDDELCNSPMDMKSSFPNSPLRQPASSLLYKSTSRGSFEDANSYSGNSSNHQHLYESLLVNEEANDSVTINFQIKSSSSIASE